jgi:hypothetical protein
MPVTNGTGTLQMVRRAGREHADTARVARGGVATALERGEAGRAHALVATARHHERMAQRLAGIAARLERAT